MTTNKKDLELNDALAFWKDATRQYWGSLCDETATEEAREGFRRYYERARGDLAQKRTEQWCAGREWQFATPEARAIFILHVKEALHETEESTKHSPAESDVS